MSGIRSIDATRSERLRIGVPADLLALPAQSGHGRVWRRVLAGLAEVARVVPLDPASGHPVRRLARKAEVVLASGHTPVPRTRSPLVVQLHESGWFDPELRQLLDPAFYEQIAADTEAAVRSAARVITPSESARREVIEGYGLKPEFVRAVPHGVDAVFRPDARGGRAIVAHARGGQDAPYVLYVSVLHPRKNLAVLREAMSLLVGWGLPHVLVIVGGPPMDRPDSTELERAMTAEIPGAAGRIARIAEPDDRDLAALMAEADAYCLPSLYEGFGLTALEAMACGTPVVVSDRGALPEVVDGAGFVVKPTPDEVGNALRRVLTDSSLADRLRIAGPARARKFTWDRTVRGWLAVLLAALDSPVVASPPER